MPRIWFLTRALSPFHGHGGLERASADVVSALRERGQDVVVITASLRVAPGPRPPGVEFLPWIGLPGPQSLGMTVSYALWCRSASRYLRGRVRPGDVIHANGGSGWVLAEPAMERALRILNPHGMEEFAQQGVRATIGSAWNRRAVRRGAGIADCVIATDAIMAGSVAETLSVPASRVAVVPNGVDVKRLERLAQDGQADVSREMVEDLRDGPIVTVGRLVRNKGYDMMPKVLEVLEQEYQRPAHWWHLGDGPLRPVIEDELSARGLRSHATLFGHRSDAFVQAAISRARVFCQPSRYEGSSLTTMEALVHSRAVVATRTGGIPDKISDGVTGLLAAAPSPHAIAECLARVLDNTELAGEYGCRGRELVVMKYSIEAAASAYLDLYERLAAERGARKERLG